MRMAAAATGVQFRAEKKSATVCAMDTNGLYPDEDEDQGVRVRKSVHFSAEDDADIRFFADLWTSFDEAMHAEVKKTRPRAKKKKKWKDQRVIERFVKDQLRGLWEKLGVDRPKTKEARAELIARATAKYLKAMASK